ncbi:pentapeptide repeat-containing protein [Candidatus Poriferisodalis sp.]|uniref:pentapeptide repeat-containing protein n=1 Tax=Candidatus Poriferisodalis sp. TaxID=3101277 RepID=UPI003B5CFDEA
MPDLRQANLVRLELREGNLSKIDMRNSKFWGADLTEADLSESILQYADFTLMLVIWRGGPGEEQAKSISADRQVCELSVRSGQRR